MRQLNRLSRRRGQRGFTLIELTVTLAITAILSASYQTWEIVTAAETTVADSTGQYLMTVRGALAQYQQDYFSQLSSGSAIPGYANPLAPTVAELKADASRLPSGLPAKMPGGQQALIQITRSGTCPGTTCQVNGMVYMNGAFTLPRTGAKHRYDLAVEAMNAMNGTGGVSTLGAPGTISGAAGSAPNPLGAVDSVVGTFTYLNSAFWQQFVRINDTRDPNLQGNLTLGGNQSVGGTLTVTGASALNNSLTVAGATTLNNGVNVTGDAAANGRVVSKASGCERVVMDPSGGSVSAKDTGCVQKVVMDASNGTIYANNGSGTTRVKMDGVNGALDVDSGSGSSTVHVDGSAGRVSSQISTITTTATANTACGAGFSNGDMVRDADPTGTILVCQAGLWHRPGLSPGTDGTACSTSGGLGQDSSGAALICRGGTWANLNNRVTRSVLMARWLVVDGNSVPQPACVSGSTASILITPAETGADYAGTPPRNRFTATVTPSGSTWIVHLQLSDSSGTSYSTSFTGVAYNFQAIAQTFCDFTN